MQLYRICKKSKILSYFCYCTVYHLRDLQLLNKTAQKQFSSFRDRNSNKNLYIKNLYLCLFCCRVQKSEGLHDTAASLNSVFCWNRASVNRIPSGYCFHLLKVECKTKAVFRELSAFLCQGPVFSWKSKWIKYYLMNSIWGLVLRLQNIYEEKHCNHHSFCRFVFTFLITWSRIKKTLDISFCSKGSTALLIWNALQPQYFFVV